MHQLSADTPEAIFAAALAAGPARPFVTYYDEASGERSELSVKSLANWVAKTHFLLTDELGLGVGDAALIALPPHWISVPAVLGALTAGLAITDDPSAASVAFVDPSTAARAAGVPDVYAVSPERAAVGFGENPPAGTSDYVAAVRPQADAWGAVQLLATASDPLTARLSRGDAVAWARTRATELGVADGARMLSASDWSGGWFDTLLVPLVAGGSVVYVRNATDEIVERRATQERATVRL